MVVVDATYTRDGALKLAIMCQRMGVHLVFGGDPNMQGG